MKSMNILFDLLTEEEQDALIKQGLACCGARCTEAGCCPFTSKPIESNEEND